MACRASSVFFSTGEVANTGGSDTRITFSAGGFEESGVDEGVFGVGAVAVGAVAVGAGDGSSATAGFATRNAAVTAAISMRIATSL